jgi:hypothetical protein
VDSIAAAPVYIYTGLDNETDGEIRERKRAIRVWLHPSVVAIRDGAFANCVHLNNIKLHDGLCDVGRCAFQHCNTMTQIELNEGLLRIGEYAFHLCERWIESVSPPPSQRLRR